MSFKGTVKNGVVVLPPGVSLADGTQVEVVATESAAGQDPFTQAVSKVAKPRPHWPKDYSRNLDHYLYGGPKKS